MKVVFAHPRDWDIPVPCEYSWMFGAIVRPDKDIRYSRIFINSTKPKWRQVITLVHELEHHVINTVIPERCREEAHLCLDILEILPMWWECDVKASISQYVEKYKSRKAG